MLEEALRRWREEPAGAERLEPWAPYEPDPRAPRGYPEAGVVLKVYTRDLPRAVDTRPDDWRRDAVNYDHAWFTREEAEGLLPPDASVGSRFPVPVAIVRRLARFHLLDNVRGETPMWREEEVRSAEMTVEVAAASPESVELRLEGGVQNLARGTWAVRPFAEPLSDAERGFDCRLRGFLRYDRSRARFVRFDLLAVGMRWGGSEHNMRWDDLDPAPMGVAFELAGSQPGDRTPPQGISAGYWGMPHA